jgi:hypothetical protein
LAAVHVLDAPETAGCDGGGLRACGHVHRGCGGVGHAAEGAEEFGQKGHGEVGEEDEEEGAEDLQVGGGAGAAVLFEVSGDLEKVPE